ncbi:MAG: molybdopterin converting factor subunit 1 [Gammaproteobacteria bacterium]|nr:molybdopterin converting factor subunit 1 [Gammaproteobacteria bacterium]MDH5613443.1 molybdopterin converting factor subunit 1 [Gammaproteobacteria bacterium]
MTISVKFFASLREKLGIDEKQLAPAGLETVQAVWNKATDNAKQPPNLLSAVNMEYVDFNHPVKDGDEVAFFPPVTGG